MSDEETFDVAVKVEPLHTMTARLVCPHEPDGGSDKLLFAGSEITILDPKTNYETKQVIDYDVDLTGGCPSCRRFTLNSWQSGSGGSIPFTTQSGLDAPTLNVTIRLPEEDDGD